MDEEEELENTLIGQQEEEAPAVNTEGALMGNIPSNNLVSFVNTTGQQSDAMTQLADTASANIGVPMTGMRPIDPTTGQPLSQRVIDAANRAGLDLPQASVPLPQPASVLPTLPAVATDQPQVAVSPFLQSPDTPSGLGGPLLRGFEMVNDAARGPNAPMGQDATRARLGGMTLNEYLNAPASTPGVSGLRTDAQGRMVPNIAQFQAQPEVAQPAVDSGAPSATAQPPVDALSSFERDSLARQQRIGGTGSFAGDSAAREARLAERDRLPGETQTERDTRIAQSRTQGSRLEGGLSQSDLRDLAQGSARGATEGERARALQIQQRAGLGEFKPDMTPLQEQALRTRIDAQETAIGQSQAASADTDSFNTSISNSTSAGGVVDYNKALNEYVRGGGSNRGYLEFLRKGKELAQEAIDAGRKPELESVIIGDPETGFRALVQDGRIMQATPIRSQDDDPSIIKTRDANIKLLEKAREDYFSGDPDRKANAEIQVIAVNMKNEFGGQLTAKDLFEPDAVNQNDNPGTGNDQPPNPNALTSDQRQAFRDKYNVN
jgi:hypothetical protein